MNNQALDRLSRGQLYELIELYSKNWLALDGVWFQSIEQKLGMDEAMEHDERAWERFTVIEAGRIKRFLALPDHPGLEGLAQALRYRFYANLNRDAVILQGDSLIYRALECRVQTARARKGMPFIPASGWGWSNIPALPRPLTSALSANALAAIPISATTAVAAPGVLP